jgi:hypothetical protein
MEELKMIVELASKVSDDAVNLVIMYFIKDLFVELLVAAIVIVFIVVSGRLIRYAIDTSIKGGKAAKALIELDGMLPVTRGIYEPLIESEINHVLAQVRNLLKDKA